jgi:hypothetical protein
MPAWFPFGFEQARAAHRAVALLRQDFPALTITVGDGRIEISGMPEKDEPLVLRAAADALIACRQAYPEAA